MLSKKIINYAPEVLLDELDLMNGSPWAGLSMTELIHHSILKKLSLYMDNEVIISANHFFSIIANLHNENSYDLALWSSHGKYLEKTYEYYVENAEHKLKNNTPLDTYEKIILEIRNNYETFWNIPEQSIRNLNNYNVFYNPLLSVKLKGNIERSAGIRKLFNERTFNFKDPKKFDTKNVIMELAVDHRSQYYYSLILSPFPYVKGHILLVPDRDAAWPHVQFLNDRIFSSLPTLRKVFPEVQIGWNAYNAEGSVNHAHFHLSDELFPIEQLSKQEISKSWPIKTIIFDEQDYAVRIEKLQYYLLNNIHDQFGNLKNNSYYNILDTAERTYLFLRKNQYDLTVSKNWIGAAGKYIVDSKNDFETTTENEITNILQEMSSKK